MSNDDENTLTILVATDNHLGYMERDPTRGQDSFDAFSEILQLARSRKVDMVLLGGDLFHDNKPSRKCLHQAMSMLRQNCLGSAPVSIEYLSDPLVDFGPQFGSVNYEDPNMNIALPVFSIHGNHDDPSGDGNLSAMDMLAVSGLVNYFGRQPEVENIRVSPVLLRKGETHLALFGLGNVRDERLHRTIARKHMTMCQPAEDTQKWFNLLVLHQNRVPHGPKNHIPEHFLSGFLDLVVWGHEHQCQVDPEYNHQKSFYVTQPGSSVATSLSTGEAVAKHVALVRINRRNFKVDKIRLKNVRPFVIEDVTLSAVPSLSPQSTEDEIVEFLRQRVEAMIVRAQQQYIDQLESAPDDGTEPALGLQPKPLIRVRVEYSGGFESFHPQRFGLLFANRVANPRDIVYFYRKAHSSSHSQQNNRSVTSQATQDSPALSTATSPSVPAPVEAVHVESLIGEFLDDTSMQMLVDLELAEAIRLFVQKGDSDAIAQSLKASISDTQKRILEETSAADVSEALLDAQIAQARLVRREKAVDSGHGIHVSARDDASVAVTLTAKKSAMNGADRKAILDFERVATSSTRQGNRGRIAGSALGDQDVLSDDATSEGNSDSEANNSEDDEFRAAGTELNVAKGSKSTATRKLPPIPSSTLLSTKRGRASNMANSKRPPVNHIATDSGGDDDDDDGDNGDGNGDGISEVDSDIDDMVPKNHTRSTVSRPSRNARTTLVTSGANTPTSVDGIGGSSVIGESDNDEDVEEAESDSQQSAVVDNKRRKTTSTRASTTRGNGRGRGRGRGKAATSASTRAVNQKLNFPQKSTTKASQMPTINIDEDDDEDDENSISDKYSASIPPTSRAAAGGGFGRFTLRKKK
ncbi:meiotic recombination [Coemansia sp. Benny D115]|nr:meiotic recombination [Coemansia sp. Benny D115]